MYKNNYYVICLMEYFLLVIFVILVMILMWFCSFIFRYFVNVNWVFVIIGKLSFLDNWKESYILLKDRIVKELLRNYIMDSVFWKK